MQQVRKLWGREKWVVNNGLYCLKEMVLFQNACCSVHWHYIKDETFYITVGEMLLYLGGKVHQLSEGDTIRIKPGWRHSFFGASTCSFLEVSTEHKDEDVGRLSVSRAFLTEDEWQGICKAGPPKL